MLDGVVGDEAFSVTSKGRLVLVVGASLALRALLFGRAACGININDTHGYSVGTHGVMGLPPAALTAHLALAGLSLVKQRHVAHFGLASSAAPLPLSTRVRDYLAWGLTLRGVLRGDVRAMVARALSQWSLQGCAKVAIGRLSPVDQQALRLSLACAIAPAGLLIDEPYAGLGRHQAALLDERLVAAAEGRDVVLLLAELSSRGPYADWLRRASDVLLFRGGRLLCHRAGAEFWARAAVIEVEAAGACAGFTAALKEAGMTVEGSGARWLVTLPEGHDMQQVIALAAATETGLIRCAPLFVGPITR